MFAFGRFGVEHPLGREAVRESVRRNDNDSADSDGAKRGVQEGHAAGLPPRSASLMLGSYQVSGAYASADSAPGLEPYERSVLSSRPVPAYKCATGMLIPTVWMSTVSSMP